MIKNKYKNKKTILYNITFASKAEANYYLHLLSVYKKEDIILQPKFTLQEGFVYNGKKERAITYIADFQIENMVIDVKGFRTKEFDIKRKLFLYKYPNFELQLVSMK